jgi:hypothetical protein
LKRRLWYLIYQKKAITKRKIKNFQSWKSAKTKSDKINAENVALKTSAGK